MRVVPDSVKSASPPANQSHLKTRKRTAVMISPLDERISLPVPGWLRTRYDIHGVDRIQLAQSPP